MASVDPNGDATAMAAAYVRTTTKDSNPPCGGDQKGVFWPAANVHYVLDYDCTADVDRDACEAAVVASFQTWEDVTCSYLSFTYDGRVVSAPIGYLRDGSNLNVVKFFDFGGWPGTPGEQAVTLTTISCETGHILDADILINGSFVFRIAPQPGDERVDIQNTLTHEVGHLAGFAHSPDPESTMFSTGTFDELKKRDLTPDDAQGLCDVYPVGHEPMESSGCGCRIGRDGDADGATVGQLWLWAALALACRVTLRRRRSGERRIALSQGSEEALSAPAEHHRTD